MAYKFLFLYLSVGALSTETFHSVHTVSMGTVLKNQDGGAFLKSVRLEVRFLLGAGDENKEF